MSQNGNDADEGRSSIRVVGVGGAGCAAINRMIAVGIDSVDFVAVDTTTATLMQSKAKLRVRLGDNLVHGHGAGGNPNLGQQAAEASEDELYEVLRLSDIVFVVAGMGGGTGTGAAPLVARVAKEVGALTIGLATRPYSFEGNPRMQLAEQGLIALQQEADALISFNSDNIALASEKRLSLQQAYAKADENLAWGVRGIVDLVAIPALINLSIDDFRRFVRNSHEIAMSVGFADGPDASRRSAEMAVGSPLLSRPLSSAREIIFSITGGPPLTLFQVNEVAAIIKQAAHPDANLIFGCQLDDDMGSGIQIVLYANDFA